MAKRGGFAYICCCTKNCGACQLEGVDGAIGAALRRRCTPAKENGDSADSTSAAETGTRLAVHEYAPGSLADHTLLTYGTCGTSCAQQRLHELRTVAGNSVARWLAGGTGAALASTISTFPGGGSATAACNPSATASSASSSPLLLLPPYPPSASI